MKLTLAEARRRMTQMSGELESMKMLLQDGAEDSKGEGYTEEALMELNSLINHIDSVRRTFFDAQK